MTGKTVQLQSASRRTLLAGAAALLGGAVTPSSPQSFPNETWLAQRQEAIIDPGLEIVDPHHHLWDHDDYRFLIRELLADTNSGHNITKTVFIECGSMYRADGPVEMKPVGETEFVNGTAAMSASGRYGPTRLCSGIVGHADLRIGEGVARVLEAQIAAGDGRFRGIRHSVTWEASGVLPKARTNPPKGQMSDPTWRAGFARLAPLDLTFEAWLYHPQLPELADLARAFPQTTIILNHVGGPIGIGPYKNQKAETFAQWKSGIAEVAKAQNVVVKLGDSACCSVCSTFMQGRRHLRRLISQMPTSPILKPVSRRSAWSARCSRATSHPTGSVQATPFCGMRSNAWLPDTRPPRRRCCSAARQSASTAWPETAVCLIRRRAAAGIWGS